MAAEARDCNEEVGNPSSERPRNDAALSADRQGWHEYNLFEVLHGAQIDAQAGSHFFSQLAMHDSWASPLTMEDLLHTARIADMTGFALPPIVAAQLAQLVQVAGPVAARASAEPLLLSYSWDLPALLDMLQGLEVTPSVAWTDYALRVWLAGGGGGAAAAAAPQLNVTGVRAAMMLLEAIYVSDAEPSLEPPLEAPARPWTPAAGAAAVQQPYQGPWRSSLQGAPGPAAAGTATAPAADDVSYASASVRAWLDACLAALLDGGVLTRAHQREDLYDMLPQLATAPSAAVVERLYSEAWPPADDAGGGIAVASPEHIASLLWVVASSGAKLPPAVIQGLLRALEEGVIRMASGDSSGGGDGGTSRGGGGGGGRSAADAADAAAASAAAAAALNAAFSLPSAPGSSGLPPAATPPPSPVSTAPGASSAVPLFSASLPLFPSLGGAPPSSPRASSRAFGRCLTPHSAYLFLWAFSHHSYSPHASVARVIGPALLAAAVGAGGGGLGPRQRCRVVRAMLMCFGSVQPHLLARYDWSPLFRGWEGLDAMELLPLLQDVATLARRRRRQRRRGGGGGGGAQLLRLSHLAAHVIQLPGWQRRLADVGLPAAVASLAGLLAVLRDDDDDDDGGDAAAHGEEATAAAAQRSDGADTSAGNGSVSDDDGFASDGDSDGGGAAALAASPFAQEVLSNWLGHVLPVIQDEIKKLTGDWGVAGRAAGAVGVSGVGGGGQPRWGPYQQQQPGQRVAHDTYDMGGGIGAAGAAAQQAEALRPSGSVAVAAVNAAAIDGAAAGAPRSTSWLPPPVTAAAAVAAAAPPPQLTALGLIGALTTLRDTAAALDPRVNAASHRTLMWAMQRLGSRAGRCTVAPEVFASVPDMLVPVDTLGWVEMPLEWAYSVVQHPDFEGAWFRSLPWPKALRAVLVSGQLVQRARAEVLRRHGADAAAVAAGVAVSHGNMVTAAAAAPSKAAALLGVAQRLRNHLLGLLAARATAGTGPELRQLALTWQVYGMPYDKEVLAVTLGALAGAAAAAAASTATGGGDAGGGGGGQANSSTAVAAAVTRGSVRDAAARLEMMCKAQQVPREEVELLFAPLRVYGM